jgi:putative ABC transport system permease protein
LLVAWQGDRIHRLNEAGVDFRLLLGSLLVALLAGAVCSLLPLFRLSRVELREALSEEGRSQGSARGSGRLRQVLMIAEVAIALVVAVVTGLLFRSLEQLRGLEPGFAPEQVLTARLFISPAQYPERAQQAALARRLTTAAREISGVTRAGAISSLPLGELRIRIGTEIEGQPIPEGQAKPTVDWRPVEPDYFETMGIPLREGRTFTEADRLDSLPVTIVDERFAERYWPGQSPIDRRLKMPGASEDGWVWAVVVGVVGHVKTSGLDSEATEQAYTPFEQYPLPFLSLVVKSAMDFESLLPLLRQTVGSVAPDQPVDVRSMKEILEESWIDRRTVVFFMQALAAVSLVLAILGVYGVMAYTVALSHQEYGVRSALGARAIDIFGLVLKRGMGLVGIGLVIGLAGAWASSRLVATLLFETSSLDPVTYLLAPVTILVAALLANVASARQATKIDIIEVLRRE